MRPRLRHCCRSYSPFILLLLLLLLQPLSLRHPSSLAQPLLLATHRTSSLAQPLASPHTLPSYYSLTLLPRPFPYLAPPYRAPYRLQTRAALRSEDANPTPTPTPTPTPNPNLLQTRAALRSEDANELLAAMWLLGVRRQELHLLCLVDAC